MAFQQQAENALSPKKVVKTLSKGMKVTGKVTNVTEFGAFVDIGVGRDGLIHISELRRQGGGQGSGTISTGDEVTVWIKDLDRKRNRISLTMREPARRKLKDLEPGMVIEGKVTRLVPYGAFVDIGLRRDGMVHVTEMARGYVRDPADVLTVGDAVQVKVLEIDRKRRRVALSMKDLPVEGGMEKEEEEALPTTMELAFRQAMARQESKRQLAKKRKEAKRPVRGNEQDDVITRTLRMHREQAE
ncbi:MAG TPA: S1 RNA-binding domain-containing protein [Anaerolineae bacterium]|nr:S1 RNA-binding domain-containing protein [Anaerolineae bacterium]